MIGPGAGKYFLAGTALLFAAAASAGEQPARSGAALFPTELRTTKETVTFGDGRGRMVTVIRGESATMVAAVAAAMPSTGPSPAPPPRGPHIETVSFVGLAPVTVIRGGAVPRVTPTSLFRPASGGELDRVAFAVEGVEIAVTAPLRAMWRPELDGPQGPMQVSAAAALDVGGGDRFDLRQNRLLGRAFLARMYERYGNWPDALAGYNWGPGNVDAWIAAGRPEERLPLETARYIEMVLRDAVIGKVRM